MEDAVLWQPLLRDALAALASPPEEQVRANGPGCIACDLLEDFDHGRLVALGNGELTDTQCVALGGLDAAIRSMQPPDLECFNSEVIRRPAWQSLRDLAAGALREFGWEGAKTQVAIEIRPGVWHRPPSGEGRPAS
jgi:hypothetical protein